LVQKNQHVVFTYYTSFLKRCINTQNKLRSFSAANSRHNRVSGSHCTNIGEPTIPSFYDATSGRAQLEL